MKKKRQKYDMSTPGTQALINEIVHGSFVKEGMMVAFPTCFPGASTPIVADESHITALDITPDGIVYGGTSGRLTHLFVAMFHGVTGVVFDLGTVEGADHCAAIGCGKSNVVACVNGPGGGRVISYALRPLPFDLIQEWSFSRPSLQDLGEAFKGEQILHAVADRARDVLVGITTHHLFTVDIENTHVEIADEIPGCGRIALGPGGVVVGLDPPAHFWCLDLKTRVLSRKVIPLPAGTWGQAHLRWAGDHRNGLLYVADDVGHLFSLRLTDGLDSLSAQTPLAPVGPMAVTLDGRVFGFCGSELSSMFCYDPRSNEVADLGMAVSVIERRRYGYTFGDAVTGRDGQIYFGEDDDLGHLWIYFPKIQGTGSQPRGG